MQKNTNSSDSQNTSSQTDLDAESFPFEKLPNFQLRADELSESDEQNWIKTPVLSSDLKIDLSPEQCEETFKFFLLSGDRLSQMTRTYHDIDALMHLLEEKERDLELAARIGQTLLSRNRQVAEHNEMLEEKLALALEESSQVRYELTKKEKLLHIYTDEEFSVSREEFDDFNTLQKHVNNLNIKVNKLEKDKSKLMREQYLMQSQSNETREKEQKLVTTTVKQLSFLQKELQMANSQISAVTHELNKRDTESNQQQGDITVLLKQINELQSKHCQLVSEHEELQQQLSQANHSQTELTREVQTLESKYVEVLGMLDDTKEEMRLFRDSNVPSEVDSSEFDFGNSWQTPVPYESSLAAELKSSEKLFDAISELDESVDSDECKPTIFNNTYPSTSKIEHKIMKTAYFANKQKEPFKVSPKISMSKSLPLTLQQSTSLHKPNWLRQQTVTPSLDSPNLGQPGVPGTSDLQRAIEKLSRVGKESLNFVHQTRMQLQQAKKIKETNSNSKKSPSAPKLQIVKPLEGSMTLHVWQNLANKHTVFPALSKKPTVSPSGIFTRGSWLQQKSSEKEVNLSSDNATNENFFESISVPASTSGTSGVVLSAASKDKLLHNSAARERSGMNNNRSTVNCTIKSVQSSPHLPSLAAALLPTTTSQSIFHGVLRTSTPASAAKVKPPTSLDLSQLHGCDKQSSSTS